jgi:hypothetical protein
MLSDALESFLPSGRHAEGGLNEGFGWHLIAPAITENG